MKSIVFAGRVGKEIRRDPLSYIFCLGFPIVMLIIMSIVDSSIPAQANMTVFHIENLAPGIAYFGLTFVMLFTAIQVSKDRTTALLLRLLYIPRRKCRMHGAMFHVARNKVTGITEMVALCTGTVTLCTCVVTGVVEQVTTEQNDTLYMTF